MMGHRRQVFPIEKKNVKVKNMSKSKCFFMVLGLAGLLLVACEKSDTEDRLSGGGADGDSDGDVDGDVDGIPMATRTAIPTATRMETRTAIPTATRTATRTAIPTATWMATRTATRTATRIRRTWRRP
jgi:hypothetical protein